MRTEIRPTPEQDEAISKFMTGADGKIQALAGTGKTSTLILLAKADPTARGQLVVFNSAAKRDAASRFPVNTKCSTAHGLAFGSLGRHFKRRLDDNLRPWMRDVGRELGVRAITFRHSALSEPLILGIGMLTTRVFDALMNFCHSADPEPAVNHFDYIDAIDLPDGDTRTYANNTVVREALLPILQTVWKDITKVDGWLPYGIKGHSYYFKQWALSSPQIPADFLLVDEAQDLNAVMMKVVEEQLQYMQVILVGDSNQQIYQWMGSIDALERAKIPDAWETWLTMSWRFGSEIASVANEILSMIGTPMRLRGCDRPGRVGHIDKPDAILCRTNAGTLEQFITARAMDRTAHIVGGGGNVLSFAKAAKTLQGGSRVEHPDLAPFGSWHDVQEFVKMGEDSGEIKALVALVEKFGAERIVTALTAMPREEDAEVIISTGHKAKGRQWSKVHVGSDFMPQFVRDDDTIGRVPIQELKLSDLRLLYVAMTRAQDELDVHVVRDWNDD